MEIKTNLPAKKEINLFTSTKNIDNNKVSEIVETIKQAKKVKLINAENFEYLVYKNFTDLNFDTVMYFVEQYQFEKPRLEAQSWNNTIRVRTQLQINFVSIDLYSESWQLNLMPNDVKEIIN
jgi:hypothetical protein